MSDGGSQGSEDPNDPGAGETAAPVAVCEKCEDFYRKENYISPTKEWAIIQDIINRQEATCESIFNWCLGLVTAITIGYFHDRIEISGATYLCVSLIVIVGCFLKARPHWISLRLACKRSLQVELVSLGNVKQDSSEQSEYVHEPEIMRLLTKDGYGDIKNKYSLKKRDNGFQPYFILCLVVVGSLLIGKICDCQYDNVFVSAFSIICIVN